MNRYAFGDVHLVSMIRRADYAGKNFIIGREEKATQMLAIVKQFPCQGGASCSMISIFNCNDYK